VEGQLTGIVIAGLYRAGEEPGDDFEEGVYLRVRTVREWLARRGLEGILR
jgi:hypothetical protein